MIFFNLLVLVVFVAMLMYNAAHVRSGAVFRLVSNGHRPDLHFDSGMAYHLFLSHIWSSGQDQVKVMKGQLMMLMPRINVFLDVDGAAHALANSPLARRLSKPRVTQPSPADQISRRSRSSRSTSR